ncbi:hypothetical protein E2C01_048762 [Portunus trituberculatus]|uniref:HTH psq-type domain-containing protein n=1 Tax=Portunus trituberculatus TaxID=210409 RepID=A0A5B7GBZ0_PORTR|nr:hypothetical protein [Portunus trituberculatus]
MTLSYTYLTLSYKVNLIFEIQEIVLLRAGAGGGFSAEWSKRQRRATSSPSSKKHNFLPFKDKLQLMRKCEAGMAHSVVAAQMGVPRSTVSTIWKNRGKYRENAASCKCFYFQKCTVQQPNVFNKKKLDINQACNSTDLV